MTLRVIRPFFIWLCRLAVAGMFIGACIAKIAAPDQFALAVYRYQLLPHTLINLVAIILPWIELTTGLALLCPWPRLRSTAALIILGMLAVFTMAISLNLFRGIDSACGCFSTRADAAVSDGWNLVRNLLLLGMTFVVWLNATVRGHPAKAKEM